MGATVQPLPGVVLIIEDNSGAAELIASAVREQGWETAHAPTGAAALAWLADHTPALVLLDYALPDMTGVQFLERVGRPLPFMVTTGAGDERTAVALMKHGARDYLIKDTRFLDTLSLALCRVLKQIETERQLARTETALQESEERFRSLLQDVQGVAVQGYGPDGTTQYWNRASEQLYGYSAAEAIGRNLVDLIVPPALRGHVEQAIREMAESGQPIPAAEVSLRRKDGSLVAVFSSHTIVQVPGKPQELFCLDIDLTERKRAEAEQARQLDELRRWQVVTLGREGRIAELKREVNGLAARLGMPLPYSTPECSEGKGKG